MKPVAIIPARGGSKRIPGKNIRPFCGKPMIAYSIEAARASGVFGRILVSTDDAAIAAVARAHGGEVPFVRPEALSNDEAGTEPVLVHALEWLKARGEMPDEACCLYATVPFVSAADLAAGLETLRSTGATSAFAVTTFEYPIFRALRLESGRLGMLWPEYLDVRSQNLPEAWHDAGQFYWVNAAKFLIEQQLFSRDSVPVRIPRWRVQDIDTEEDWRRAELMFRALQGDGAPDVPGQALPNPACGRSNP
jgi:pseudaminic acid cytidylyltransferase